LDYEVGNGRDRSYQSRIQSESGLDSESKYGDVDADDDSKDNMLEDELAFQLVSQTT